MPGMARKRNREACESDRLVSPEACRKNRSRRVSAPIFLRFGTLIRLLGSRCGLDSRGSSHIHCCAERALPLKAWYHDEMYHRQQ